ncbi:hypothetical protein A8L34_26745 [Bacillus sp. FJAT-27264]|uniref:N-acetylmuramoyl-L-alanine amidase n=1 Tax=Paenibacillus sp. (strain DSM 101736 / FJAT-27264) TaxID=1850362 RepID=UPI000807EF13|nr:N-acetylmuramoyl-L-alanine amidase [Bacillus sp. FJAT-27264]OBZ16283.1 hypothetical protein A8L34_26745 [Bacillus sp. FJAT-27264]
MKKLLGIAMLALCIFSIGLQPPKAAAAISYTAKVNADSLNVRSEPAKNAVITGSLKNGTVVSVTDEQHGWLKVKSGSTSGWVAGYYLQKTSGTPTAGTTVKVKATPAVKTSTGNSMNAKATVTASSLRIRSGPGTSYSALGSLKAQDTVTILQRQNGWLKIRTASGDTGWVSDQYIRSGASATNSAPPPSSGGLKGKLIVVDPGHGGSDPGMLGTTYGTLEKDLNLQTAFYVRDYLQAAGARVEMTRTKDVKPSLAQRAQLGKTLGADAFVSIHYNSSPKKISGTLTFFYSESTDLKLARAIEARLGQGIGLKSNGVSFGDYHILRENSIPSALMELGFLSTPSDEALARTASYQKKAAQAIANGLADYFRR